MRKQYAVRNGVVWLVDFWKTSDPLELTVDHLVDPEVYQDDTAADTCYILGAKRCA